MGSHQNISGVRPLKLAATNTARKTTYDNTCTPPKAGQPMSWRRKHHATVGRTGYGRAEWHLELLASERILLPWLPSLLFVVLCLPLCLRVAILIDRRGSGPSRPSWRANPRLRPLWRTRCGQLVARGANRCTPAPVSLPRERRGFGRERSGRAPSHACTAQ